MNEDPILGNSTPDDNDSELFHPSSYERGFKTSAYVGIFLSVVGILFNLLLFTLVFISRELRANHLYIQVVNIAVADLTFIVTVDSFTVYFELQSWDLGAAFCKVWIILDVILPSVSLLALLILNLDRILFVYKTNWYQLLTQRRVCRFTVILFPWCVSCVIVNTLWLGFPVKTEPNLPGACLYGITKEANDASIWLTVFMPSLSILVLLIFIFLALVGEIPSIENPARLQQNGHCSTSRSLPAYPHNKACEKKLTVAVQHRIRAGPDTYLINEPDVRRKKQFIAALLVVDLISLAITLPFSAYSQVSFQCTNSQNCQSLITLFQILSWMKSSATFFRPVFFILLTDISLCFKKLLIY